MNETRAKEAGLAVVTYGVFINAIIAFLIVAWVLFFVVRGVNTLRRSVEPPTEPPAEDAPAAPPADIQLLGEIRDLLKNRPV